jgi:glucose/arabinose dehydrogenase
MGGVLLPEVPPMSARILLPLLLLVASLAAAAYADPTVEDNALDIELVVGDLQVPTTMAFIGPNEFFVLQKDNGQVIHVDNGAKEVVLDLDVEACEERGLLGIAVHPDFAAAVSPKPWVYLYYTESKSADDEATCDFDYTNRLMRFTWNGNNLVDPFLLHSFPSFVTYHLGGPLAFGPDGKIYGVNGDGEQNGTAQNEEFNPVWDDTGVIFRLNEDGERPADNPFNTDGMIDDTEDCYWAYGVRNSFGLAFDPFTGDLWDTENGENVYDEINRVIKGANSGWRDIMGPGAAPAGLVNVSGSTYIEPEYSIFNPVALTGLAFASMDTALGSAYEGDLFAGDFNEGQVYKFEVDGTRTGLNKTDFIANNQNELNGFLFASGFAGGVTDLKEGPDGNLYVVAIGLGEVWRITGGGPATHDISFTSLKPPKKVAFTPNPPAGKPLKLSLQNLGTATETIQNQAALDDLIEVTFTQLGNMSCAAPAVTKSLAKGTFPYAWEPRKKLSVSLGLTWNNCFNDQAATTKTEDHDDFTLEATLDLDALGQTDGDAGNDACPRAGAGDDKGCGKQSTPFRIDLYLK